MQPRNHIPLVEVTRGSIVESVHYGSIAIAQPDGKMLLSLGDMDNPYYLRSSAKPFQTQAFLEAGGVREYDLTLQEIAVICASHSGTDEHVQVLEALQAKIGIQESMLQCGIHTPYDPETARNNRVCLRNFPSPIVNLDLEFRAGSNRLCPSFAISTR